MSDSPKRNDGRHTARRQFLRLSPLAFATSLAGCSGDSPGTTTTSSTTTETTQDSTTTGTTATETTTSSAPSLKTKFKSRERYRSPGESLDEFETLSAWQTNQGSMTASSQYAFIGSKSAKLVGENGDHAVIQKSFTAPKDFTDTDVSVALRTTTPDAIAFFVQLIDTNGNAAEHHLRDVSMRAPDIGWFRTCPGVYQSDDGFDRSSVDRIRLRVNNASSERAVVWVDDARTHPKPDKGYVILSWDDGKRSYYRKAAPIRDEYGLPATLTQPPQPSAVESELFMSLEELKERQKKGDEVAAHGSVKEPFARISTSKLDGVLRRNKQWLIDNGFEGVDFIVYPGNNYDAPALDVIGRYHYMGGMNQSGSVNTTGLHGFDPLVLPRTIGHDLSISKQLVDRVAAHRNVGILNFHDFASDNTMDVPDYRSLLDYIDRTTGIEVITFSDLWKMRTSGP